MSLKMELDLTDREVAMIHFCNEELTQEQHMNSTDVKSVLKCALHEYYKEILNNANQTKYSQGKKQVQSLLEN